MLLEINGTKWFSEIHEFWAGQALNVAIKEKLFEAKSKYQKIEVYETVRLGKMLVLDDAIQLTEFDEFAYHEMFVHVPMNSHPNPERLLVIGGGDGGILREACKYPQLKEIHIVEIDEMVIEVSKKYLPFTSIGYEDPRVKVFPTDGFKYLDDHENYYDIILVDSSDPIGPAENLFKSVFYEKLNKALRENGIAVTQAESFYLHLDEIIKPLYDSAKKIFKNVDYYMTMVPTYPSGMIGLMGCSKGESLKNIIKRIGEEEYKKLKYYNYDIHVSAFNLPKFAKEKLS